jgi:hypothetical protein
MIPPPGLAVDELRATLLGVYAAQFGSMVVVVVDAVVVLVVVVVGIGVGPGHATASPASTATRPGNKTRFLVRAVIFMIPLGNTISPMCVTPRNTNSASITQKPEQSPVFFF